MKKAIQKLADAMIPPRLQAEKDKLQKAIAEIKQLRDNKELEKV